MTARTYRQHTAELVLERVRLDLIIVDEGIGRTRRHDWPTMRMNPDPSVRTTARQTIDV
jgi:hypothetical protein